MSLFIEDGLSNQASGADDFITENLISTGSVYWVDSQTGNDSNFGTESQPFATISHAVIEAVANFGDIIVIKSGHTEVLTSPIVVNKAGLKIYGIGNGSAAPNFTVNAAIDAIHVTANDVEINNLYFPVGTTIANNSRVNVDAAHVRLKGLTFMAGAFDPSSILLSANALYARIESCSVTVTAAGPNYGVLIQSAAVVGLFIKNCAFNGGTLNFSLAGIYSAFAHLNFYYQSVTLTGFAPIIHTANAKGSLSNIIAAQGSTVQT